MADNSKLFWRPCHGLYDFEKVLNFSGRLESPWIRLGSWKVLVNDFFSRSWKVLEIGKMYILSAVRSTFPCFLLLLFSWHRSNNSPHFENWIWSSAFENEVASLHQFHFLQPPKYLSQGLHWSLPVFVIWRIGFPSFAIELKDRQMRV